MHVVGKNELQVVVDEGMISLNLPQTVPMLKLNFHGVWIDDSRGHWQVVHESIKQSQSKFYLPEGIKSKKNLKNDSQMHEVFVFYPLSHFDGLLSVPVEWPVFFIAKQLAGDVLGHSHLIGRIDNPITPENFPQVLRLVL